MLGPKPLLTGPTTDTGCRHPNGWRHLGALAAVQAASALAVAGASGASLGVLVRAGVLEAAGVVLVATALAELGRRRRVPEGAVAGERPLRRVRPLLVSILALGAATFAGVGGGTFATFNAETSNLGSSLASGTLTMSDKVGTGAVCASANATTQDNVNSACDAVVNLANLAPGVASLTGAAQLTIANTGSLDASKLYLSAPYVNATLNAGLTQGGAVSPLTVTALEGPVTNGDSITLAWGTHSQSCTASAGAAGGATSISVTCVPATANFSYPVGTRVTDTSTNTGASNTDCYDAKTTTTIVPGSTIGTDLNYNAPTGNPLCTTALLWVQETTGGKTYCWSGKGSSPEDAAGLCVAPIAVNLASGLTNGTPVNSLSVTALNGNVRSGDSVVISEGNNTLTCTASSTVSIGAVSIPINSCTPLANYSTSAKVTDSTVQTTLNADSADTISAFDLAHPQTARLQLSPITVSGTVNASAVIELNKTGDAGSTRIFWIGLYIPAPAGSNQNGLQGLQSKFGFVWHIDQ